MHDLHLDHYGYRLRAHKFQIVLEMDVTQLTKDFNLMRIRCTLSSKIFSCPKNIGWIAILTTITFWVNKKMFFFTQNKDWKSKPFSMLSQTFIHKRFHIMHISPTSFYIEKTYCKYHWKIDVKLGYFATTLQVSVQSKKNNTPWTTFYKSYHFMLKLNQVTIADIKMIRCVFI